MKDWTIKASGGKRLVGLFLGSLLGIVLATYVILPVYRDLMTPDAGDVFSSIVIDDPRWILTGSYLTPVETADGFELVGSGDLEVSFAGDWIVVLRGKSGMGAINWKGVTSSSKKE